jgi:choline dehydrogenase-like flavoprotein
MSGLTPADIARTSSLWGDALDRKIQEEFGHSVTIECPIDMQSYEHNFVDLDPELKDYFGSPAPRISLSISEYEAAGIQAARRMQTQLLEAFGVMHLEVNPTTGFMAHPAGTCRMGAEPATSVVDPNLRCQDVRNLYLVGTPVFVTGGLANPTLTIGAFALRLADHLVRESHAGRLP